MNCLLALMLVFSITGEDTEQAHTTVLMDAVDPAYILGPGDVLWFSSQGGIPGDSTSGSAPKLLEVAPDGYVVLPSVGAWKVSGLSLGEATYTIQQDFARRFPGLTGLAGLARMRVFQVPVTGHVNKPGIVEITGADGLVSVLDEAGGIASSGSMTGVEIIGSDGDTAVVNITDFLEFGDMTSNPYLSLGDRVHVPEAQEFVWVEGAVNFNSPLSSSSGASSQTEIWSRGRRGMVEYIPGETVRELLSRVGGTAEWAQRDQCYISRTWNASGEVRIPAPLDSVEINPVLQPGDVVVCPGTPPVVMVSGEVFSPGVFPYTAGMDPNYYIAQAGGYVRESRRSGTSVMMPNGEEMDADHVSSIPAGSTIIVPRKPIVGWEDPLLILTSVASIVIAWKSIF